MPASTSDEFFVGYLTTPTRLRRFLAGTVIAGLVIVMGAAALITFGQRDPGTGEWDLANSNETIGVVTELPYPMLRAQDQWFLLVSEGKVGASELVAGLNGQTVKVRGTTIMRDGLKLIEVARVDLTDSRRLDSSIPTLSAETLTLRGEIIDPKCHSGAMKPGDGKAHKACAVLCIRGGIPPAFVDTAGARYLLLDQAGAALRDELLAAILPFVGDSIELTGRMENYNSVKFLRIDVHQIHRLTP